MSCIDAFGTVMLGDFAVGRALAAQTGGGQSASFADNMKGYLAPECARGLGCFVIAQDQPKQCLPWCAPPGGP